MKNPTGNKLEKLTFRLFDQMVEGADKYVTDQGSTWLIFTDEKKWVIEFTKDRTLWFNYNLFQSELELIGKDCVAERDLIKNWFEDRFLNKPKVDETLDNSSDILHQVENTIQNGVKHTETDDWRQVNEVENTIQNGVKHTREMIAEMMEIEDTIQNGVKDTLFGVDPDEDRLEDTIQNGVKYTNFRDFQVQLEVEDTIQNGVKYTGIPSDLRYEKVNDIIQNGVKDTKTRVSPRFSNVEDTIQNGVKKVKSDEGYMNHLKQLHRAEQTIEKGVKEVKTDDEMGKRICRRIRAINALDNGVKEVKTSGDGDIESTIDFMNENNTLDVQKLLDDVIENGVKEVKPMGENLKLWVNKTIENGVKELKELPDKSGEFRGYGDYYRKQKDMTKPFTEYVKEVIEDPYNHKSRVEGVIRNTNKDGI